MDWGGWSNFWAMGGRGFFVWGSYGITAAVIVIELWLLTGRRRAALDAARRADGAR